VRLTARVDRFQQRHAWFGFPWATLRKYGDDQGGYLAATLSYYGFFSIFPLLLVITTILGWVLSGNPELRDDIVSSAVDQFPIVGDQQLRSLNGSGVALAIGLAAALWSGMRIVLAAGNAMNQLWGVPFTRRPDYLRSRVRALALLLVLGTGTIAATVLGSLSTVGADLGIDWKAASIVLSTALNVLLFWVALKLLTGRGVSWRMLRGGAVAAAIAYEGLQLLGGYYVNRVLRDAGAIYGTFGVVIGLLSWIYLAAHILLLAGEANVVATRGLWPRSFSLVGEQPPTEGDRRALTQRAKVEERRSDEEIDVRVGEE
jgi:YihY family inner membrane protein